MKKSQLRNIIKNLIKEQREIKGPIPDVEGDFINYEATMPLNEQGGTLGCTISTANNYDPNATGCCSASNPGCGPMGGGSPNSWQENWCCDFGPMYLHLWAWRPFGGNWCGGMSNQIVNGVQTPFNFSAIPSVCSNNAFTSHMFMDFSTLYSSPHTFSPPQASVPPYNNPSIANTGNSQAMYLHYGSPNVGDFIGMCHNSAGHGYCIEYIGLDTVTWPYTGYQSAMGNGGFHYWPGVPVLTTNYGTDCVQCLTDSFYDIHCPHCGPPSNIFGCTDPTANNYDPNATQDDGSCTYDVYGCLGVSGANGICVGGTYAGQSYTNGAINHDCATGNTNYPCNDGVTIDDGSCIPILYGCTDQNALNYYAGACVPDNNSCVYIGCADPNAINYAASNIGCSMQGPTDTSCCDYPPPPPLNPCDDLIAWENHAITNYPQLNGDPIWRTHFCEYCIDGTIPPGTDSYCKCCPSEPDIPVDVDCCDWCATLIPNVPSTPPVGCNDFDCDKCPPTVIERFQKLANISKK
jgi:hypothetical protein